MKSIHSSVFCQNCGEDTSGEIAFCRNCGTALSENQVWTNIERSRQEKVIHVPIQDQNPRTIQRIAGIVAVGFLEFLFVATVFFVSLIISVNFLPDFAGNPSGSIVSYLIIMTTACVASLSGGSYLSKKLCEKYPEKAEKLKRAFSLEEEPL